MTQPKNIPLPILTKGELAKYLLFQRISEEISRHIRAQCFNNFMSHDLSRPIRIGQRLRSSETDSEDASDYESHHSEGV